MLAAADSGCAVSLSGSADPARFVFISGYHDYRSRRRVNLHFVADELVRRGEVFFLSLRYSPLTRFGEDPRHDLRHRVNCVEEFAGVACYLWRTPIHACRLPSWLAPVERIMFALFENRLPRPARSAIGKADVIFVESGIALIYLPLLKRLAPRARIIYLASDSLTAINQAETIKAALRRYAGLIDVACLPSPLLRDDLPAEIPCCFVPHGIEKERFADIGPSPFRRGTRNAISVGSMLFDPTFFQHAAPRFPDVTFHVIGSGHEEAQLPNLIYHPEMPFEATLPFIKHATFAIAPYSSAVEPYLTHTSMKLMQYGYLGVPAVCPESVTGGLPGRFGYAPGDAASIENAIGRALQAGSLPLRSQLSWQEVTERWLHPEAYPDTEMTVVPSALRDLHVTAA